MKSKPHLKAREYRQVFAPTVEYSSEPIAGWDIAPQESFTVTAQMIAGKIVHFGRETVGGKLVSKARGDGRSRFF